MFANRNLNDDELAFISSQVNQSKKILLGVFIVIVLVISTTAFAVYSEKDSNNYIINILFGILIMLLYFLNWFVKGYKNHIVNAHVHKSKGFYQRIYESRGKNGRYFDTINGTKIKVPWHWRKYLKSQKEQIDFEYIVRDGAVALNEGIPNYLISVNDTLSLHYEIKNGLRKAKPISFLNIASLVLIIPVILVLTLNRDIKVIKDYKQIMQSSADVIPMDTAKNLASITAPSYIKINNAWIYQYKPQFDFNRKNYLISKAERDRIYNHKSSHLNYQYYLQPKALTKPDKEAFKKQFKKNAFTDMNVFKILPDSIREGIIDKEFDRRIATFNKKVSRAKNTENILNELKPKTTIFKLDDHCFNLPEKRTYSIKKSLENTFVVHGFYNPENNTILNIEAQAIKKKRIKNALILFGICAVISIGFFISIFKIIRNSRIKKNLVKKQLDSYHGPTRIES